MRDRPDPIAACVCGECGAYRRATQRPDFCACGARHDQGAPIALIRIAASFDSGQLELRPWPDFAGDWDPLDAEDLAYQLAAQNTHATVGALHG